jgi:trehalose synthase
MPAAADLQPMAVAPRAPGEYAPAAGGRAIETLHDAAAPLRGARVLHVSVAGAEGRVPELLGGLLPLAAGSGVEAEWRVLFGSPELRATAAALQSGLRGGESGIEDAAWEEYLEACEQTARSLGDDYDAIVLHDAALGLAAGLAAAMAGDAGPGEVAGAAVPGGAAGAAVPGGAAPGRPAPGGAGRGGPAVLWRLHEDASRAEPDALARALALAERCSSVLVPHESFVPGNEGPPAALGGERLHVAPPGIDPLDPRNLQLEARLPGRVVRPLGVDLERPFCLQVLELDRWDDPHAAIDAFRLAKEEEPDLQLVLAALLDRAATESWQAAKEISDYAQDTDGVLLLTTYEGLGSLEVGALLLLARTVIERSLRESFELAPFEALWKRTPVVGGLPLAIRDGVDGFLAPDTEDAAAHIVELVRDPGLAIEMGRAGRERVREHFLVTAALERELRALAGTLRA